jgi:hypothetical protein
MYHRHPGGLHPQIGRALKPKQQEWQLQSHQSRPPLPHGSQQEEEEEVMMMMMMMMMRMTAGEDVAAQEGLAKD